MEPQSRIWVAGASTMIGRSLHERLADAGFMPFVGKNDEPDLADGASIERFLAAAKPDHIFLVGGKTAGIVGNQQHPADLMTNNLLIAAHVIPAAFRHGVKKLLYLSSSCTYPKLAPQPLDVSTLWTGALEPTSAAYAVAKLAGVKLCEAYRQEHGAMFITAIGADAYGPGDDFSPEHSHVVAALLLRMHEARESNAPLVSVWGSGSPRREFIFVDDLADACIFAMRTYNGTVPLNLGTGTATSIAELAHAIREVVNYAGELKFDRTKPDGMPFKGLDSSPLHALGWQPRVPLTTGLERTYEWLRARLR